MFATILKRLQLYTKQEIDLCVSKMILKVILDKYVVSDGPDLIGWECGSLSGLCDYNDNSLNAIEVRNF